MAEVVRHGDSLERLGDDGAGHVGVEAQRTTVVMWINSTTA